MKVGDPLGETSATKRGGELEPDGVAWRILAIPHTVGNSDQPAELLTEVARRLAEELRARQRIVWLEHSEELPPLEQGNRTRVVVSSERKPDAFIELQRDEPFDATELQILRQLELDLSARCELWSGRQQDTLLLELRNAMRGAVENDEMSQNATAIMMRHFGAEAGILLINPNTTFASLATIGDWPPGVEGSEVYQQFAHDTAAAPVAVRVSASLVACPIGTTLPARCVLLLRFPADRLLSSKFWLALAEAAHTVAPYLEARWREGVLRELLNLNQAAEESSSEEMYALVLDAALTVIPGADSGTLLTRTGDSEAFTFQAARGFDLEELRRYPMPEQEVRDWYGPDSEGWQRGSPRIMRRGEDDISALGRGVSPGLNPAAAKYEGIAASLCLPVLHDGVVMATLNLENMSDPNGFGRDSREIASLFGSPLASLLHRQRTRDLLRVAALTDELTGLPNRRAFNDSLRRELAREGRRGAATSVLMLDMRGFKLLNDRHGHAAGDSALVMVASELRSCLRAADLPSRWGGDEMAAILVDTPAEEAATIGERILAAVSTLEIAGEQLAADIGIATSPADGNTPDALVELADSRMYANKLLAQAHQRNRDGGS